MSLGFYCDKIFKGTKNALYFLAWNFICEKVLTSSSSTHDKNIKLESLVKKLPKVNEVV